MKIISRQELLKMPRGTLFAEASGAGVYGELCILGDTSGPDFTERGITYCVSDNFEEKCEREEAMWDSGASFPVNPDYGREGYFDHSMRYLVYDLDDVQSIISALLGGDDA